MSMSCVSNKKSHNEICREKMYNLYHSDIENSRITKNINYYKRKFRDNPDFNKIMLNDNIDNKEKLKKMKMFNYSIKLNNL